MPATPSRLIRITAVPLMLAGGGLLAVQSQINGRLARGIGDGTVAGITAATISFGSGFMILALATAAVPRLRAGVYRLLDALRAGRLSRLGALGGCFGAWLVTSQGLTVATIGVALFSVALTAGQSTSGLAVDHAGLGPGGRQRFSLPRGIAAAFAVVAVVLAAGERLVTDFAWEVAVFAVLPFLAGVGLAVQQALNGKVTVQAGAWASTFANFAVGTAALVVVLGVACLVDGPPAHLPDDPLLYAGGAIGIGFIWISALLVHVHGVLVLGLCLIAGQVITASALEIASGDAHIGPVGIAAGVLTVVGVGVALLVRPRAAAVAE